MDACRLRFEFGRVVLATGIGHGLLAEVGERKGWGSGHSSEANEGLAVILLALVGGHGLVMKAS